MYRISEYPQLIAHRGYSGPYPENTRVAIEAAMRLGVDMVEVDVRITRDGVPVLLHNVTLDETTNGRGRVDAHRFDELHGYDAGAWKGPEFRGERLLSLRETFLMTRDRMPLNLDIKTPAAIAPVIALIQEFGMLDQVVLSGCNWRCVRRVWHIDPRVRVLLNGHGYTEAMLRFLWARCAFFLTMCQVRVSPAFGVNVSHRYVGYRLIHEARARNLGVWTWTVDDPVRARELARLGVVSITSNWPDRLMPALRVH